MTVSKYLKYFYDIADNIFDNVRSLRKRKNKYNTLNVFNVMIASSFGDNKECNFKHLYDCNKKMAESTRSYWSGIGDANLATDYVCR